MCLCLLQLVPPCEGWSEILEKQQFPISSTLPVNDRSWISSVHFSRSVVSNSLRPHESQHARPPCPSPTHGVHSDSRPSSQWCHPAISSSVVPFSNCEQILHWFLKLPSGVKFHSDYNDNFKNKIHLLISFISLSHIPSLLLIFSEIILQITTSNTSLNICFCGDPEDNAIIKIFMGADVRDAFPLEMIIWDFWMRWMFNWV